MNDGYEPDEAGVFDFASRHPAVIAALSGISLVGIKVILVSDRSSATALGVLSGLTLNSVISGLFVALLPTVAIYALVICAIDGMSRGRPRRRAIFTMAVTLGLVAVLLPLPLQSGRLWIFSGAYVLALLFLWIIRAGQQFKYSIWSRGAQVTIILCLAATLASWSTMWLPPEAVSYSSSTTESPVVGYVLRSDETWTAILVDAHPRRVIQIATPQVLDRTICTLGDEPATRTIYDALRSYIAPDGAIASPPPSPSPVPHC